MIRATGADTLRAGNDVPCEVSIVMPCLNEAATVGMCVRKAHAAMERLKIDCEVIVADNGSSDGSLRAAKDAGARVVNVLAPGYGSAVIGGVAAARGRFVIMGDSDDSYDFSDLQPFIEKLREGYQLVMGNRFTGGIRPGAMPFLHRYVGNPVLSGIGRLLFHNPCGDFHCGLRAFDRQTINELGLHCTGMEFASEMIARASMAGLRIAEVPTTLSPDGRRGRSSHLRCVRDGLRHLWLMASLASSSRLRRRLRPPRTVTAPQPVARWGAPAFSLVELLVVIGIIAVLASIMVPAMSAVSKRAQRVSCLSNLRQLVQAYTIYTGENKGKGIGFAFSAERSWIVPFRDYSSGISEISLCPSAGEPASSFGSAFSAWTLDVKSTGPGGEPMRYNGSYGFNGWLFRWEPAGRGGEQFSAGPKDRYLSFGAPEASLVPVFADATWLDGWPRADDPTPPDLQTGDAGRQGPNRAPRENMIGRFTIARHGRNVNVVFLDGHGDTVELSRLKRLKWHSGFVYQDWVPALPKD